MDPSTPVTDWTLSPRGLQRWRQMLTQPWLGAVGRVVSSAERKALEAATLLAAAIGSTVEQRPATGELDRSSTGYVPSDEHERLADECFAQPDVSAAGWERAVDAQARIVAALEDLRGDDPDDVVVVGHGGIGTLWWCHLAGVPIDRRWDQPGQGHSFVVDRAGWQPRSQWMPIERGGD